MKRIRRLRDLDQVPVSTSWDAVRATEPTDADAPLHAPSRGRRAVVIAVAFGLFAASVGVFLFTWGDDAPAPVVGSPAPGETDAATSLTITCDDGGAKVSAPTVALGSEGVALTIENPAGDTFVAIRDPQNPDQSLGLEVGPDGRGATSFPMAPGPWIVGCFSVQTFTSAEVPVSEYPATFEVVDPDGNWRHIQEVATCGGPLPDPAGTAGEDASLAGPMSGQILLSARDDRTGATTFVSVNADGSGAQRLFPDLAVDEATFSPDGSLVALVISDSDGDPTVTNAALEDSEIYVANADGSGLTRLTDNQRADDLVHWTPDGTLISFRSNRGKTLSLYTMRPDGSNVQQITPDTRIADAHDWSSYDGSLVFSGEDERAATQGCFDNEILLLGHDGVITPLTDDEWYDQSPTWSPDGSRIVYAVSDQSDYAWEIFTMNADGSDQRRITDHPGYDMGARWSPDGTMIAFTSDRFRGPDTKGEDQSGLPYAMNADGSGVRALFTEEQLGAMGIARNASVSVEDWRA
ncbi:MAG: TolB family protein [Actinomycetota bacterium]